MATSAGAGGRGRVAGWAAETGGSHRHLRGRFRDETGLTPKAAARVIRFDRARRLLQRRAACATALPGAAGLAADRGYYDQAHLAREFRELAGSRRRPGWLRSSETSKPGPAAGYQAGWHER